MIDIRTLAEKMYNILKGSGMIVNIDSEIGKISVFDLFVKDCDLAHFADGTGLEFVITAYPVESQTLRHYYCVLLTTDKNHVCFLKKVKVGIVEDYEVVCDVALKPIETRVFGFLFPKTEGMVDLTIQIGVNTHEEYADYMMIGFDEYPTVTVSDQTLLN